MTQIFLTILANWFGRTESLIQRHISVPREQLCEVEQQLSRRLRSHFRDQRHAE